MFTVMDQRHALLPIINNVFQLNYAVSFKITYTKLEVYIRSIEFEGTWLFNKLPIELKTENSLLRFEIKLGEHFSSSIMY